MANVRFPPIDTESEVSLSSLYLERAAALTGNPSGTLYWEDMATMTSVPLGWTAGSSGTGSVTRIVAGSKGGLFQLSSGASAGGGGEIFSDSNLIASALTDSWWYGVRFKATTVPDGTSTRIFNGIYATAGTANGVTAGVNCASASTTNFVVTYDGAYTASTTVIDSGIPFDTTLHTAEIYVRAGDSKLRVRWDGGAENAVPPTMVSAATGAYGMICSARNVSQNAAQTQQVDWIGCYYPHS